MPQGDGRRGYDVVQDQRPSQAVSSLVERHEVMDMFRLSKVQYGIYAECIQNPDSTRYNIPAIERMPDHMDVDRLVRAVDALMEDKDGIKLVNVNKDVKSILDMTNFSGLLKIE